MKCLMSWVRLYLHGQSSVGEQYDWIRHKRQGGRDKKNETEGKESGFCCTLMSMAADTGMPFCRHHGTPDRFHTAECYEQ